MKEKNITQAYLIENGFCTKTTISRICRNSNDKKNTYNPSIKMIMTLGVAFELTPEQVKELFDIAFPEFEQYNIILEKKMNLAKANELLFNQGLPLLGTAEE